MIALHAGHNKSGKIACGAVDYLDESKECRWICRKVVKKLKRKGIKCCDVTVNNGKSQTDVLMKIVDKIRAKRDVTLNISFHMNANTHSGKDGKVKGVECWIYPGSPAKKTAEKICDEISKLGFTNRGVKTSRSLYILHTTNEPTILIELCFVDDKDDATLWKKKKRQVVKSIVNVLEGV